MEVMPVLGAPVPVNSAVTVRTSFTRAWRAWMRTQAAKNVGKILVDGQSIEMKQPAYYVFQQYHDSEQLMASGVGSITNQDATPASPVIYWKANKKKSDANKPASGPSNYTITFP